MTIRKFGQKTQHDYVQRVTAKPEDVRGFQLHLTSGGAGVPKITHNLGTAVLFQGDGLTRTQKESLVLARCRQGRFRQDLLNYWHGCAVPGCTVHSVLGASHIKPWRNSSNEERLDPHNGLLLTANLDALFIINQQMERSSHHENGSCRATSMDACEHDGLWFSLVLYRALASQRSPETASRGSDEAYQL